MTSRQYDIQLQTMLTKIILRNSAGMGFPQRFSGIKTSLDSSLNTIYSNHQLKPFQTILENKQV